MKRCFSMFGWQAMILALAVAMSTPGVVRAQDDGTPSRGSDDGAQAAPAQDEQDKPAKKSDKKKKKKKTDLTREQLRQTILDQLKAQDDAAGKKNKDAAAGSQTSRPASQEARKWFDKQSRPWKDALGKFSKKLGKPIVGLDKIKIDGNYRYYGPSKITRIEAMTRVNRSLIGRGWYLLDLPKEIKIVSTDDIEQHIPPQRRFASVESFEKAALGDMDYAVVDVEVTHRPAKEVVDKLSRSMQRSAKLSSIADDKKVRIVATASHVRRFLILKSNHERTLTVRGTAEQRRRERNRLRNERLASRQAEESARSGAAGTEPQPPAKQAGAPDKKAASTKTPLPPTGLQPAGRALDMSAGGAAAAAGQTHAPPPDPTQKSKLERLRAQDTGGTPSDVQPPAGAAGPERTGAGSAVAAGQDGTPAKPPGGVQPKPSETGRPSPPKPTVDPRAVDPTRGPVSGVGGAGGAGGVGQPPVQPEVPDDGRTEWFSYDGMPWEDVIASFAKRIGKPLMNEAEISIGGELTYISSTKFTKQEAIDELNFLLIYENWRFVETPRHIYAVPLPEMSQYVDIAHTFQSIEAFDKAELRDMEYVVAYIDVKDHPAKQIEEIFNPSLPDYALLSVVGDTNKLKVQALVRDIRRLRMLMSGLTLDEHDPRQIKFIKIETNVRDVERMIREVFPIARVSTPRVTPRSSRSSRASTSVSAQANRQTLLTSDDRTNMLIVKALPAEMKKIEAFIKDIDKKTELDFVTKAYEIVHANAVEVANILTALFQQEQGQTPAWQQVRSRTTSSRNRRRTPSRTTQRNTRGTSPADVMSEGAVERAKKTVRITPNERTNYIYVYANKDGHERVAELLKDIDQPLPSNFRTFKLEHAQADQIYNTVSQIVSSLRSSSASGGTRRGFSRISRGPVVTLDSPANAFHVIADKQTMKRVEEVINQLDVEADEGQRHILELVNLLPSRAVNVIRALLGGAGGQQQPFRGRRGVPGRGAGPTAVGGVQLIPIDEAQILVVICSDEQWRKIEQTIAVWDERAITSTPKVKTFPIRNGDPTQIANVLNQFFRNYQYPGIGRSAVIVQPQGDKLYVQGIRPALDEIESLLETLDVEDSANKPVILPLAHADALDVAQRLQRLFGQPRGRSGRFGFGGGGNQVLIDAEPVTNSLIVQADAATLEKIKNFAQEMDEKVGAQQPEQKFYSPKNASPRDVLTAINSLFVSSGGRRGSRGSASQVKAVIVGSQVVVTAPAAKQSEIASVIMQLDDLNDKGITTLLVKMPGADVRSIARKLSEAFRDRVRNQGAVAQFSDDTSTETILVTVSADIKDETEDLLKKYQELTSELVWETRFYQLKHATANDASRWLREQLVALVTQQIGSTAARQVKVTGDQRTNRVFVNAPQVAVTQGMLLLEEYDKEPVTPREHPVEVWTTKLAGLDVRNLASIMQKAINNMPKRPDGLKAVVTHDQLTSTIIVSAPRDMKPTIDKLIETFSAETAEVQSVQIFIQIEHADANGLANQVRRILGQRLTRTRGKGIAQQVNIEVDARTNRLVINAPKFAIEMAEALVAELDQETTAGRLQTIALVNTDANTMYGILRTIFREKIANRTLQISSEPITNSLIVGGSQKDFEEIKKWAENLEAQSDATLRVQKVIELENGNPWEINTILQQTFVLRRRVPPSKQVNINILAGRSLVITAPPEILTDIEEMVAELDKINANDVEIRLFPVPGLGAQLTGLARDIEKAVNSKMQTRERRISISAIPARDVLVVTATQDQFPAVESAMEKFKSLHQPHKIETIELINGDANTVYQALQRVLRQKIRAGKVDLAVEWMTNSLIVSAAEEELAEIREWAMRFDEAAKASVTKPRMFELQNASPWEVRTILTSTFMASGANRRRGGVEFRFDILGGRTIVAKAPADKMDEIEALIAELDSVIGGKATVRTYKVAGMGARLSDFARQIQNAINQQVEARERRISIAAFPIADTLVVTATEDQFGMIDEAMKQFQPIFKPLRMETITLAEGDANTVYNSLRTVLREEIRAGKIQLAVEPMTNSLIVMAAEEQIDEIRKWAVRFDEAAATATGPPQIFELKNASPYEVRNVLNTTFLPRGRSRRQSGKEVRFDVIAGRALVVMAPAKKMPDIAALIEKLDKIGGNKVKVKTYEFTGMGNSLNQLARQIATAFNSQVQAREGRISVTAYAPADALIVTALEEQFETIEQMMEQFIPLVTIAKSATQFFVLEYVDAAQIVGTVQNLVRARLQSSGKSSRNTQNFSVSADPRTNRLIVLAPETVLPEVAEVVAELDIEVPDDSIATLVLDHADPREVATMLNQFYGTGRRGGRRGAAVRQQVQIQVSNNTLIVKATPKKLQEIKDLVARVDAPNTDELQIKTYDLKVLNATQVAMQVSMYLRSLGRNARRGEMQPAAFPEPTTNTLVVIAPPQALLFIDTLVAKLESKPAPTSLNRTYVLKNARADQIAQNVQSMLQAKIAEREGNIRKARIQTAVFAHADTNRLFVFAPDEYQDLAEELILMIDQEVETGELVHIVQLEQGNAVMMAQTLNQTIAPGRRGRSQAQSVKITADAGTNSLVISGLPKDVAKLEKLITELEGKSESIPELQIFQLKNVTTLDVIEPLNAVFAVARDPKDVVTVTADDYYNRLLVTANRRKMRQVERIIAQVDVLPDDSSISLFGQGREMYYVDIYRGDATDIAWDVSSLFPIDGGPRIEADWFGEYITVVCRPSEFPRIEKLIREKEARARVERKTTILTISNMERILPLLREQRPDLVIKSGDNVKTRLPTIVERLWDADETPPGAKKNGAKRDDAKTRRVRDDISPCYLGDTSFDAFLRDIRAENAALAGAESPASPTADENTADSQTPPPAAAQDQPADTRTRPAQSNDLQDNPQQRQRERAEITILPNGRVLLHGPESEVDDLRDAIDLIVGDIGIGEVIRIFEFRYGDAGAAAEILDRMFNERRVVIQQPQRGRQGQQQQGRQGQQGQQGQQGGRGGQQQSIMDQMRAMMGGRGAQQQAGGGRSTTRRGQRVRIAIDAGHNYLIVKCDEADLPEIRQLLRELDIPPGQVDVRVFQLKNLTAVETAQNIKDVLGISKARQPRGRSAQAPRGGNQQQLIQMLQQQLVSMQGVEGGTKIESVEIVPNNVTNSLLISAPPDVMKMIEGIINELEDLQAGDILVIGQYVLENSRLDDVLPLLQEIFAATGGGRRGGGGAGRATSANPAALGAVTISGDRRSNTIIYVAEAKDVETVERQIQILDFESAGTEAETYVCEYGDATTIANLVQATYATGAGGGGRGPRGAQQRGLGANDELRIIPEPSTNAIVVWGPPDKREIVMAKIVEFDKLAADRMLEFHEVPVAYIDPEKLAATLNQMFGGSGVAPTGTRGGRGGGRRGGAAQGGTQGRLMIVGNKASSKLLVRAPKHVYQQILEVVQVFDVPNQDLQLKRFELKYANAQVVVDAVKAAFQELMFVAQATGQDLGFDAFTAMPDPRTNAVLVVGSQKMFMFIDEILRTIDVETPDAYRKVFRVFVLDGLDPTLVADAINSMSVAGAAGSGGGRGGQRGGRGGRRGGMPAGGGLTGAELDVVAWAEPMNNAVVVRGTADDIEIVLQTVIEPWQLAIRETRQPITIPVLNAPPSQLASFIRQFLAGPGGAGGMSATNIIPVDSAKALIVSGTKSEVEYIRTLVERFDDPNLIEQANVKVVEVPLGQDAQFLAREVERIVNSAEMEMANRTGAVPRLISIGAEPYSNALMLAGDPSTFGIVESVLAQLVEISGKGRYVHQVVYLENLSAEDAQAAINELQRPRGSSSSRGGSRGGTRGGFNPGSFRQGGGSSFRPGGSSFRPSGGGNRSIRPRGGTSNRGGGGRSLRPGGGSSNRGSRPRSGAQQNRGNPRRRPGGGALNWNPTPAVAPFIGAPLTPMQPVITSALFVPSLLSALFTQNADGQDAGGQDAGGQDADESRRPQDEQPPPASRPAVTVLQGELRGEVVAVPMDSRRLLISGDERDVQFVMDMLNLMDSTTPKPVLEIFKLENAKAGSLGPVVQQTINALIGQRTSRPGPGDQFSIISESRSNSLIVSASEANMADIAEVIARLDQIVPMEQDMKTVALLNVRAADAAQMITPMIQRLNEMREVPQNVQATVQVLDRANSLVVIGTPRDIEDIERMIKTVDVEIASDDVRGKFQIGEMLWINLKNASAPDVATALTQMIEAEQSAAREAGRGGAQLGAPFVRLLKMLTADGRELPPLDLEKPIRILADQGTNSLIVFSTKKNNEALVEIVDLFDTLPEGEDIEVKSFALQYADASEVAELIQQMFDDSKRVLARPVDGNQTNFPKGQMPPVPQGIAGKGLPYPVVVSHDGRSNTVFVIGRVDAVQLAAALVTQMDVPGMNMNMTHEILELKNVQASVMSEKLTDLLDKRAAVLGKVQKNPERESAIIVADDRANLLIVMAAPDVHEFVAELAGRLDSAETHHPIDIMFRPLEYADSNKLQAILQELFDRKRDAGGEVGIETKDALHIIADTRSNSLMMTGTRDFLAEASQMLDNLDRRFEPTMEFAVRPVRLNSAPNIAALLQEMIDRREQQARQGGAAGGTPIYIVPDRLSNNLVLGASHEDMEMLDQWIEVLDKPVEMERMTRIIPLRRGDAQEIAASVQTMYERDGGGGQVRDVTVTAQTATNSIIVVAPPTQLRDIEEFLRKMEEAEITSMATVKIFKLEQADAEDAGELLSNILQGQGGVVGGGGGGRSTQQDSARQVMLIYQSDHPDLGPETLQVMRDEVVVISDTRTNTLVIVAPPDSMPLMESLVAAIDIPPDAAQVRVVRLRNADAEDMVETLEALFDRDAQGGRGGEDQERQLVLEGMGGLGGRQAMSFTSDVRTNSVIAAGTKGYLDLAEELIIKLDSIPIQERKVLVYTPRNNDAESIATSIREFSDARQQQFQQMGDEISAQRRMEHEIVAIANADSNVIVLGYDPQHESDVFRIVQDLDQPPPQVMIQVLIIEVTLDNSVELGVEFAFQDLQFAKAGPTDTNTFDFVGGTDLGAVGTGLGGFTFTVTGADFNFLIRALQNEGSLKVLSRPMIMAMDNQEANFEVGNDVPFVSSSTITAGGNIQTQVARRTVGINLTVTPQINPDGFVRMQIRQEVSDISGSTVDVGQGVTAPIFFERIAETTVTVMDNETIVLGGLIQERKETREQKIPILGDLPLIGWLFRNSVETTRRSELLIVLTPRVIRTVEDFAQLSIKERDLFSAIDEETLTSPMMEGLRVKPEELFKHRRENMFEPSETEPADMEKPADGARPEPPSDEYGPVLPSSVRRTDAFGARGRSVIDPTSYDLPLRYRKRR